ncbi:hypothetical protein F503_06132 [Ophiostoma piceae UAMH 11346]|uniref:Uncharacterized protein n=1 Tax=Ophiostoma piceae (strain UAMH 11346) TaxID=1262450 RepID=S3C7F6_OPHP1|nr:hypothetical protein F503_06132 [Ophiostoma piceae UAMH 11346]
MGNCSSCLGTQRRSVYEEDDESRMLFEDGDGTNYGSFGDATMNDRDEARESQREAEALQSVVTRTSDNMVDVFEIAPPRHGLHGLPAPYTLGMPGNQFQNLLSKLSDTEDADLDGDLDEFDDDANGNVTDNTIIDVVDVESVDNSNAATQSQYHKLLLAKADAAGLLVGNFTDAAVDR